MTGSSSCTRARISVAKGWSAVIVMKGTPVESWWASSGGVAEVSAFPDLLRPGGAHGAVQLGVQEQDGLH
jgi:hypothetical protein